MVVAYALKSGEVKIVFEFDGLGDWVVEYLERRLENVVYRMGFAKTRRQARQIVSHGHVLVNGRRVNIASYRVKVGDVISIVENSKNLDLIKEAVEAANAPAWMELDKAAFSGKILQNPNKSAKIGRASCRERVSSPV